MIKEKSKALLDRIKKKVLWITGILAILIYFFTKSPIYCIIFLCGSVVSFLGFIILAAAVSRILEKKKGKGLFFLSGAVKMGVIAALFILISKHSEKAVLFYMLGLSVFVLAITLEGVSQLYRSKKHGA
ncbi:MAG: ATP synthase subunit I [Acidobacteriota bacterium]